jgi:DMSO/TMAO reductase YedYZ molybdopterin-dependent catalytic subunit
MVTTFPAWAASFVDLDLLAGGPKRRDLTTAFPQKGHMILQRTRPPLLEAPFEVFDRRILTPNEQFYVRWHWAVIPWHVDVATFRMAVRGHVNQALSLSMAEVMAMPRVELTAVNQCLGNSRGMFQPGVAGAQWENGATNESGGEAEPRVCGSLRMDGRFFGRRMYGCRRKRQREIKKVSLWST